MSGGMAGVARRPAEGRDATPGRCPERSRRGTARSATRQRRERPVPQSRTRTADAIDVLQADEHVARLRPVGRPKYAGGVQLVDDPRGSSITHLETPLQQRRGTLAMLDDHFRGFPKQLVAIGAVAAVVPIFALMSLRRFALPHLDDDVLFG